MNKKAAVPDDPAPPQAGDAKGRQSNSILSRAESFSLSFDRLVGQRTNPLTLVIEDIRSPVEARVAGKPTLLFGTNSYLGMNFRPECIQAAQEEAAHRGVGSTASRVAAGNQTLHRDLEADIAALHGRSDAIVFSTGFMANLGVISGLAREGDAVFLDAHCHASIHDACRLSGAKVRQFRHNDAGDLARLFAESDIPGPNTIVVVEGVYSVWGDVGELQGITAVANQNDAIVIVDEAHSLGMYGARGRGVAEDQGVESKVDIIIGTFSKSMGLIGGYAVTDNPALRRLRFMARPYLFTASLPPPIVAAARQAVNIIATDPQPRERLWANVTRLHAGLKDIGLQPCAASGPVGAIRMSGAVGGYGFWKALLERGIYVNLLVPPATPNGEVLLRFSVSAAHSDAHIDAFLSTLREVSSQLVTKS